MEIKIVFEIEKESRDAVNNLANALISKPVEIEDKIKDAIMEKVENSEDVKGVHEKKTKKAATKKDEIAKEEPKDDTSEEVSDNEPRKADPVPTVNVEYTRADLARVGRELAQSGKRDDVLKAFTKFHALSLADVKPEDFNELAQIYIELGGKF